ncbi:DUF4399 domain-containing protein [Cytophagales bacterium RKSG123]|nr:DUF4399 domain-containing protein [Xanthovirga aplysinae]
MILGALLASCNNSKNQQAEAEEEVKTTVVPVEKAALNEEESVNKEASVFFVNLQEGEKVTSPLKVEMGVIGMDVEPAGEVHTNKGHHHIIVDGSFVKDGEIVPMDKTHLHFGKGQKETELELAPGKHSLTLQFADGVHKSYGEGLSKTIEIEVVENTNH